MSEPVYSNACNARPQREPVQHWGVDVRINGRDILTIESNCLFGLSDLTETELQVIRDAAKYLLAFAGDGSQ